VRARSTSTAICTITSPAVRTFLVAIVTVVSVEAADVVAMVLVLAVAAVAKAKAAVGLRNVCLKTRLATIT
jgi:hypothetical protein